jgi:hypothetical protein
MIANAAPTLELALTLTCLTRGDPGKGQGIPSICLRSGQSAVALRHHVGGVGGLYIIPQQASKGSICDITSLRLQKSSF